MKKIEPTVWESPEGYTCAAVFNPHSGTYCGYIFLPETDKAFVTEKKTIKGFNDALIDVTYNEYDIEVHGGLTYGRRTEPEDETKYPTVINKSGIWLGFDCNHYNDAPDFDLWKTLIETEDDEKLFEIMTKYPTGGTFRDEEYVKEECESMSRQLRVMTKGDLENEND